MCIETALVAVHVYARRCKELERRRAEGKSWLKIPVPSKQLTVDWIIAAGLKLAQKLDE
jgi:hypothetical protein